MTVSVDDEGLEVATEQKRSFFRRTGGVRVIERAGLFIVDPDRGPVAIPVRHLSTDEQQRLREWVRQAGA